jgi:hypothetical protein
MTAISPIKSYQEIYNKKHVLPGQRPKILNADLPASKKQMIVLS